MKCDYCGNEIPTGTEVMLGSHYFCNNLHKYYWENERKNTGDQHSILPKNVPSTISRKGYILISSIVGGIIGAIALFQFISNLYSTDLSPKQEIPENILQSIHSQAEIMVNATLNKDYDKLIDFTYPKVVELAGDKAKMLSAIQASMDNMTKSGMKLISYTVLEAVEMKNIGGIIYCIVPSVLKIDHPKGILQQQGFMIAISVNKGIDWKFIDGTSQKNKSNFKIMIPEAFELLTLPEWRQPVMIGQK